MTKAILSNYAVTLFQYFGETDDFARKNNGETDDFGQKNFGVSEKWLVTIDISISNSPNLYQI